MHKQELLQKYLNNKCTMAELHLLYEYLQEDDEAPYREIMYKIWQTIHSSPSLDKEVSERMYANIVVGKNGATVHQRQRSFFLQTYWKVAASVSGVFLMSVLFYLVFLFSPLTSHTTAFGETEVMSLPDGTVIHLYANSRLSYPPTWEAQREVWLEGEAYFKVQKLREDDDSFPQKFIVHTSNLDIEVLGTEFNVKDRRGNTQVVLNSGVVKLTKIVHETQELTMEPGDIVEVGQLHKLTLTKVPEPDIYSSWKDNLLHFEDMTLAEVAVELQESHGIEIAFENKELAQKKINAFTPVDNLDVLFTTIGRSFNLKISKYDNEYVISQNRAAGRPEDRKPKPEDRSTE
jgi:transmembrane sensor